jgi:hypothetical protein
LTKKELAAAIFWTLVAGAMLGYTLGLIQQAAQKTKAKNECEVKQQHSW